MGSSDPILSLLKDFSYQVVRLPRANIRPLQILSKTNHDLVPLGEAPEIFIQGAASIPTIAPDDQAGFINGKRTRSLDLNVGLNLLGGIIGAMTGTKANLGLGYKKASNLVFEFDDVKVNTVSQIQLNKYFNGAKIDPSIGSSLKDKLNQGQLYVIISTIKSNKFTTDAEQANGMSVEVDVPVIKGIVSGNVRIKGGGEHGSKVTYTGAVPLVFGIQAARIDFLGGVFRGLVQLNPDDSALRDVVGAPAAETKFEMLEIDGPFVNLKGEDEFAPAASPLSKPAKPKKPAAKPKAKKAIKSVKKTAKKVTKKVVKKAAKKSGKRR